MKNLIVCLVLVFPFILSAQEGEVKATSSEVMKYQKNPFQYLLAEQDGKLYSIGAEKSSLVYERADVDLHLQILDSRSMSLLDNHVIERFEYNGEKTRLRTAFMNRTGFHLFYTAYDSKENTKYLLHQTLDKKGNAGTPRMVADMHNAKSGKAKFSYIFSEDNESVLIYEEVSEDDERVRTPVVTVINVNGEELWTGKVASPFPDGLFVPVQLELSKAGELFILGFSKRPEEKLREAQRTTDYGIVRIGGGQQAVSYRFNEMHKIIHSAALKPDYLGSLLVVGYYADEAKGEIIGSFFGKLDQQSLAEKDMVVREFADEVFANFSGGGASGFERGVAAYFTGVYKPAFEGLDHFKYKDFIPHPDGGVIVVSERQYTTFDVQPLASQAYLYYDEIAVSHFGEDGSLLWFTIIPKNQALQLSQQGSYFLHPNSNGLHFIYNDHPDNLENIKNNKSISTMGGLAFRPQYATVDYQGKVSYRDITASEKSIYWFSPEHSISVNKESIVAPYFLGYGLKYQFTNFRFP